MLILLGRLLYMKNKVSQNMKEEWKKRYLAGETGRNIAKDYPQFHESTIMRHIKKMGISRGSIPYKVIQKTEDIVKDFLSGQYYCKDLAIKYELDEHTIYKILDSHNLPRKTGIRPTCDITYFQKIDTPHKAYLLGFITADGSITGKHSKSCSIEIHKKDIALLEYAKKQLQSEAKIQIIANRPHVKISFSSVELCKSLARFGVVPNKTKRIQKVPVEYIPKHLLKFYFRGLIDGDGCIHADGKISIYSGSLPFIESVQEVICKEANVSKLKIYYGTSYFITWSSKQDKRKLYNYLYKNCLDDSFYYKRKYLRLYNNLQDNTEVINQIAKG